LLLLFAFAAYKQDDPSSLLPLLSHLIRFGCAFLCGLIAAKSAGESGLWCGLLSGSLFLTANILPALLLSRDGSGQGLLLTFGLYLGMLALSAVGGAVGVSGGRKTNMRKTKRRRPNRHPASS